MPNFCFSFNVRSWIEEFVGWFVGNFYTISFSMCALPKPNFFLVLKVLVHFTVLYEYKLIYVESDLNPFEKF